MNFKPRRLANPMRKERLPQDNIVKWNPPIKDNPIVVSRATIEENIVSSPGHVEVGGLNIEKFIEDRKKVRKNG